MLTRQELRSYFQKKGATPERIGLEVEVGTVNPASGVSIPYEGTGGVKEFLTACAREFDGDLDIEGGNVVGVRLSDEGAISIEHHGGMEFSSPPYTSLSQAVQFTHEFLRRSAEIANGLGIALLTGGNLPFNTFDNFKWMPLLRGPLMRNYLDGLGHPEPLGKHIMGFALATQTTLDYVHEDDLIQKLRMLVAISPVAAALFVNSPIEHGHATSVLSRRLQYWDRFDPVRCGAIPPALAEDMTLDHFVDWALDRPIMFRETRAGYQVAPKLSFSKLLRRGFADGSLPTNVDWISHLSQILTDLRLRDTIEMRMVDGQAMPNIFASVAFWVGITYHRESRRAAWDLMKGALLEEYRNTRCEVAISGLRAMHRGQPVRELAKELVRLAKCGLNARIDADLEPEFTSRLLDPIEEVANSGKTFAERCLERWRGDLQMNPANYVRAFRI